MSTASVIWKKVAAFLKLSDDATETEADIALEKAGGFQGIVDSAVSAAVNDLTEKVKSVTARLDALEQESATLKAEVAERDKRIGELTAEMETAREAAKKSADETAAAQKQATDLSAQIAQLKAGIKNEQQEGDDGHASLQVARATSGGNKPIPILSKNLAASVGREN